MIEITKIRTYGWGEAIRGMRNSYNSWDKSDSEFDMSGRGLPVIGQNDLSLMKKLCTAGTDHCKFRRMITVSMDINAPLYWWKEFDTYKVGTVTNSCSTMHKIAEKEFTLEDFSNEHLMAGWVGKDKNGVVISIPGPYEQLQSTIDLLNNVREMYLYVLKTPKEEIDWSHTPPLSAKDIWWQMIQLLPSSYNQRRTIVLNYEVLANIYKSRKGHKLDEWKAFCDWIQSLPYSELITGEDK